MLNFKKAISIIIISIMSFAFLSMFNIQETYAASTNEVLHLPLSYYKTIKIGQTIYVNNEDSSDFSNFCFKFKVPKSGVVYDFIADFDRTNRTNCLNVTSSKASDKSRWFIKFK